MGCQQFRGLLRNLFDWSRVSFLQDKIRKMQISCGTFGKELGFERSSYNQEKLTKNVSIGGDVVRVLKKMFLVAEVSHKLLTIAFAYQVNGFSGILQKELGSVY